jgi:hypothetical protein
MTTTVGSYIFKIWDKSDGSIVKQLAVDFTETKKWCEFVFANAVNLVAGKTYAFTIYGSVMPIFTSKSYTMNPKVVESGKKFIAGSDAYPTETTTGIPTINMLLGAATTESAINEYKIKADTMASIASEVIRITGGTKELTPGQIYTALQGIAVQTTE